MVRRSTSGDTLTVPTWIFGTASRPLMIVKVLVNDGDPVDYGQPLFKIKPE